MHKSDAQCSIPTLVMSLWVCLGAVLSVHAEQANSAQFEEHWQTIWNQGVRVGYTQTTQSSKIVDGQPVIISDVLLSMTLNRFHQQLTIRQRQHLEERPDGELLRLTSSFENPPASRTSLNCLFQDDSVTLTSNVANSRQTREVSGMSGVRSSVWLERYVAAGNLERGVVQEFQVFEPQLGMKCPVSFEYIGEIAGSSGEKLREVISRQTLPGGPPIETVIHCRQDWSIQKASTPLLKMEMRTASAEEALAPLGEVTFDLAADTMVRVAGLTRPESARSVQYRVVVDGASPQKIFVEALCQKIEVVDDETILITVSAVDSVAGSRESDPVPNEYLESSQFLAADSPLIQDLAKKGGKGTSPTEIAQSLEKFVNGYVSDKNFSTVLASAVEVAQSRAGDCTEHAVLLAALLRAKKIPSRVAIGFVYSESHHAFVGHMWTEAWIAGQWQGLDATLGRGRTGCGHLTISTSSLSDHSNQPTTEFLPMIHLLGRTKIDVIEVIR